MRCVTRHQLTAAEKRTLASADLTVTRYAPDGERAEIRQLAPEGAADHGGRRDAQKATHAACREAEGGVTTYPCYKVGGLPKRSTRPERPAWP